MNKQWVQKLSDLFLVGEVESSVVGNPGSS